MQNPQNTKQTETQGKTTNTMTNQEENTEKLLRIKTGYDQHTSPSIPYATPSDQTSKIFNTLWQLKNRDLREATY
jgi:hypothetical protein